MIYRELLLTELILLQFIKLLLRAAELAREGKGPSLIEAKAYRFGGHHPNDPAEYREKEEVEYHKKEKDPVKNFKKKLLDEKVVTKKEIDGMEEKIRKQLMNLLNLQKDSPEPQLDIFLEEVSAL